MKYAFRRGSLTQGAKIRITTDRVQLLTHCGTLKREIKFSDLNEICEFSGVVARDEQEKRVPILHCVLVPTHGRSITIISAGYITRGVGYSSIVRDNEYEYRRILREIKERAVKFNSKLPAVIGNKTAMWLARGVAALSHLDFRIVTVVLRGNSHAIRDDQR